MKCKNRTPKVDVLPRIPTEFQQSARELPGIPKGFHQSARFSPRIPTGFHQSAQGCEGRATLGQPRHHPRNPERVVASRCVWVPQDGVCNPFRVDAPLHDLPRVARSSQPWAERWHPFRMPGPPTGSWIPNVSTPLRRHPGHVRVRLRAHPSIHPFIHQSI